MFIVLLEYVKPLEVIDKLLEEHISFLDRYYSQGKFICSGRRTPRIGGVILVKGETQQEVQEIINEDPFYIHQAADYKIIEFTPTKYAPELASLLVKGTVQD